MGVRGRASGNRGGGGGCDCEGGKNNRIDAFRLLPCPVVLTDQGKSYLRYGDIRECGVRTQRLTSI